jgi:hypothetical protein
MSVTSSARPASDVDAQMRLDDDGAVPVLDPLPGESAPTFVGASAHAASVGAVVPIDVALKRTPLGRRRGPSRPTPAARPPERAQLVWGRALELAEAWEQDDRFAHALSLLRAAHHDPATMAHALTLGRTHLRAHAGDAVARRGARILEAAIAFLGVKPRTGDLWRAGR